MLVPDDRCAAQTPERRCGDRTHGYYRAEAGQAEAARQREELAHVGRVNAIGELAASLAHEINQPLTAIMNNADAAMLALNAGVAPLEDLREILEDIATDGSRAGDVILRLRAQLQCRPMDFRLLDLNELIRKTTGFVRSDAAMRDIRVVVQLDSAPLLVRGDGVQLAQVVINLALNAFDAMRSVPTKRRQVTLSTRLQDTQTVVTTVRDRGSGLAAADIERIFEPFYTTKANGLGMGLSIARSILAVHGGRLWVESYPDAGSTFFFSLPCASDAKEGVS